MNILPLETLNTIPDHVFRVLPLFSFRTSRDCPNYYLLLAQNGHTCTLGWYDGVDLIKYVFLDLSGLWFSQQIFIRAFLYKGCYSLLIVDTKGNIAVIDVSQIYWDISQTELNSFVKPAHLLLKDCMHLVSSVSRLDIGDKDSIHDISELIEMSSSTKTFIVSLSNYRYLEIELKVSLNTIFSINRSYGESKELNILVPDIQTTFTSVLLRSAFDVEYNTSSNSIKPVDYLMIESLFSKGLAAVLVQFDDFTMIGIFDCIDESKSRHSLVGTETTCTTIEDSPFKEIDSVSGSSCDSNDIDLDSDDESCCKNLQSEQDIWKDCDHDRDVYPGTSLNDAKISISTELSLVDFSDSFVAIREIHWLQLSDILQTNQKTTFVNTNNSSLLFLQSLLAIFENSNSWTSTIVQSMDVIAMRNILLRDVKKDCKFLDILIFDLCEFGLLLNVYALFTMESLNSHDNASEDVDNPSSFFSSISTKCEKKLLFTLCLKNLLSLSYSQYVKSCSYCSIGVSFVISHVDDCQNTSDILYRLDNETLKVHEIFTFHEHEHVESFLSDDLSLVCTSKGIYQIQSNLNSCRIVNEKSELCERRLDSIDSQLIISQSNSLLDLQKGIKIILSSFWFQQDPRNREWSSTLETFSLLQFLIVRTLQLSSSLRNYLFAYIDQWNISKSSSPSVDPIFSQCDDISDVVKHTFLEIHKFMQDSLTSIDLGPLLGRIVISMMQWIQFHQGKSTEVKPILISAMVELGQFCQCDLYLCCVYCCCCEFSIEYSQDLKFYFQFEKHLLFAKFDSLMFEEENGISESSDQSTLIDFCMNRLLSYGQYVRSIMELDYDKWKEKISIEDARSTIQLSLKYLTAFLFQIIAILRYFFQVSLDLYESKLMTIGDECKTIARALVDLFFVSPIYLTEMIFEFDIQYVDSSGQVSIETILNDFSGPFVRYIRRCCDQLA